MRGEHSWTTCGKSRKGSLSAETCQTWRAVEYSWNQKYENILLQTCEESYFRCFFVANFLFRSKRLASLGLSERDDQYAFYTAVGAGLGTYLRNSYKIYVLQKYTNEPDPNKSRQLIVTALTRFSSFELQNAPSYLEMYKKSSRMFFYPLSFLAYEFYKRGPKFWKWREQ